MKEIAVLLTKLIDSIRILIGYAKVQKEERQIREETEKIKEAFSGDDPKENAKKISDIWNNRP